MQTLCGMRACGKVLASATSAAVHVTRHSFPRRAILKGQVWRVRYDRRWDIAEVLDGPKPPKSGPPDHEGFASGAAADGSEIDDSVSSHVGAAWATTPCLCDCHYGKPECNEKACA